MLDPDLATSITESARLIRAVLVIAPLPVYKRSHKVRAIEMTSEIARRVAPGVQ